MANLANVSNVPNDLQMDIYRAMLRKEELHPLPGHPVLSPYVECYPTLGRYLITEGSALGLSRKTVFLADSLMSRILADPEKNTEDKKPCFQRDLLVCMLIAAKVTEHHKFQLPTLTDLYDLADGQYTMQELERTERSVLRALGWAVNDVTTLDFFQFYQGQSSLGTGQLDAEVDRFSTIFLGLTLQDPAFLPPRRSLVAAAILKTARAIVLRGRNLHPFSAWTPELVNLTGYTANALQPCCARLITVYNSILEMNSAPANTPTAP